MGRFLVRCAMGVAGLGVIALLAGCDSLDGSSDQFSASDSYQTSDYTAAAPADDSYAQQQDSQNQVDQIQLDTQAQDQAQNDQILQDLNY